MPKTNSVCQVCEEPASALHFGALSCRACAAFFRRRTAQKKPPAVKCDMKCRMNQNSRRNCPSCRFKLCLKAGMKSGSESAEQLSSELGPSVSSWKKGYESLENARKHAFGITEATIPKPSTYTMQNVVITIDFKLITNHLISEIDEFRKLEKAKQKTLLSQFIAPFHILESTYKSAEKNRVMLANGDYIDHEGLDKYYKDLFDAQHQLAFRVFKPYWDLQHRIIRSALDEVHLDRNEFLFLVALMLWDIDFHECDEDLMIACKDEKQKLMKELCQYEKYREFAGELEEERSMRVGRIVSMLQGMQRTLSMLHESHEVSQFYQLDTLHDTFFELLKCS